MMTTVEDYIKALAAQWEEWKKTPIPRIHTPLPEEPYKEQRKLLHEHYQKEEGIKTKLEQAINHFAPRDIALIEAGMGAACCCTGDTQAWEVWLKMREEEDWK